MRGKAICGAFLVALAVTTASAQDQQKASVPIAGDLYCSGIISSAPVPRDTYLITGEQSNIQITFQEGNYVYINKGSQQGVKVGDEFQVIRAVKDPNATPWDKWQKGLLRALGTMWEDEGRLRVVVTQPNVSIAQITDSCSYMQRGDVVLPFQERTAPPLKPEARFDRFAPPSGREKAMVVVGKRFQIEFGTNDILYVNLGSNQGVKVGDYFRVFRYQGTQTETAYQTRRQSFRVYGFGAVPTSWNWSNVPREVLGEGVVLRTAPNASTVLITFSLREIFAGDYVELE